MHILSFYHWSKRIKTNRVVIEGARSHAGWDKEFLNEDGMSPRQNISSSQTPPIRKHKEILEGSLLDPDPKKWL
jgi:hypothetical protein